jgi:hypothetical protein
MITDQRALDLQNNSVSVLDLKKYLDKLPDDARIMVKQEGYYAESEFCDIYFPDQPEYILPNNVPIYVLATSSQHY